MKVTIEIEGKHHQIESIVLKLAEHILLFNNIEFSMKISDESVIESDEE